MLTIKTFILTIWCYIFNCNLIEITLDASPKWKTVKVVRNNRSYLMDRKYYFNKRIRKYSLYKWEFKLEENGKVEVRDGPPGSWKYCNKSLQTEHILKSSN